MMTMMTLALNLNARVGKIALIAAAAAAVVVFAALGAPAVIEAAGAGQAQAVADGSCDNGYWPVLVGGLFGWLMDLLFNLCGR